MTASWKSIEYEPKLCVHSHTGVLHSSSVYIFGGEHEDDITTNALYKIDMDTRQSKIISAKNPPLPRKWHNSVLYLDSIYILFGCNNGERFNDMYEFNILSQTWRRVYPKSTHVPCCRSSSSTIVYGNKMIAFGGFGNGNALNDVWEFCFLEEEWERKNCSGLICCRYAHSACIYQSYMYVYGGHCTEHLYDLWFLDIQTWKWVEVKATNHPKISRAYHSATVIGDCMIILGGDEGEKYILEEMEYNFKSNHWKTLNIQSHTQSPIAKNSHVALNCRDGILVMGGYSFDGAMSDLHILNYYTHSYRPTLVQALRNQKFCDLIITFSEIPLE